MMQKRLQRVKKYKKSSSFLTGFTNTEIINLFLVLLFSFSAMSGFTQNSYRAESDIREAPRDIVEYYLIIPGRPYHRQLQFNQDEELSEFQFRKLYLRPMPDKDIVIDKKNAFIRVADRTFGLQYQLQMTYFLSSFGPTIGVYEVQEGGDCDSKSLIFYNYLNKQFIDVTSKILPRVSIKDFCPATDDALEGMFEVTYELPKEGTIITMTAKSLCEQDKRMRFLSGADRERYYSQFKKMNCAPVKLLWNKTSGSFEKKANGAR